MPLHIVRNDITRMQTDAIVNAANSSLLGGGGVDGCIHRAAGPELKRECATLGGCVTGDAKVTRGYNLPCKYVIHTVGPIWHGGTRGERELLISCYRRSLELAREYKCESVAFPLISAGAYGYPTDQALDIAVKTIADFIQNCDMTVYIVIFDRNSYNIGSKRFVDIESYIDDNYVGMYEAAARKRQPIEFENVLLDSMPIKACTKCESEQSLTDALDNLDESFSEMLMRKIDERGMTDAQCYKKANIDRKLFSKIRSDRYYRPSKPTVIAFALALELPPDEFRDMLMKAGFALSHSSKFDIIVEYFILRGNYNVFEINEALFAFDQSLIGA